MAKQKTSTTAYIVASSLAKLSRIPKLRQFFTDDMIRLNLAFARHGRDSIIKNIYYALPVNITILAMDYLYVPGMVHHYLFRKLFIEHQVINAIQSGIKQVIILGAGLDTLSLRYADQYSEISFIEIDLPVTQQAKLAMLNRLGERIPTNLTFASADLGQASLDTIQPINRHLPSVVILEGVLMYLSEAEVKSLFLQLHATFLNSLTVIFGAVAKSDSAGNFRLRLMNRFLALNQEATKWYCPSRLLPLFMADLRYTIIKSVTYKNLQQRGCKISQLSHLPAEDENYYVAKKL